MRLVILLCLACTVFASLEEDKNQWEHFKSKHGKLYMNVQEEKQRFSIFQQNLRKIEEHNTKYDQGKTTYRKGVNQFADLTKKEFLSFLKRGSVSRPNLEMTDVYEEPIGASPPSSIDWRNKGAVSEVKNQGDCGSCWAFSVTGTLESFYYLKNNKMVTFSEQQLVDCCTDNGGCDGGYEDTALEYVVKHGIETEKSYPYKARDQTCRYDKSAVFTTIKTFVRTESRNESSLKSAVGLLGPISVALDASKLNFYESGVYNPDECSQDNLDHAVLAVGYGKDSSTGLDYWLIKNSWSADWGENGYFKIRRGSNLCGIASDGMYPVY